MKTILVTGGCGFIGANFIRYLFDEADFTGRVINADKLTYAGNPENLSDIAETYSERYVFEKVDICDFEAIERVFIHHNVDGICHFAAESHVDRSIVGPGAFVETNVMGTFNLLELARKYQERLALFHHVSTDEVFGSLGKDGFFVETTPYQPKSPYSASKAASDHLVRAYHHTYGIPITLSNCSNNYGPYQFPEKLIPLMILNAMARQPLPVYGDGQNVRDWLYVTDHCAAIWRIMQLGRRGETYNIGGDCEKRNLDVVNMICDMVDELLPASGAPARRSLITFVKDRPGHDWRYAIDFSKITAELNWRPTESFSTGLRKTVRWYIDHQSWVERVKSGAYQEWVASHYGE